MYKNMGMNMNKYKICEHVHIKTNMYINTKLKTTYKVYERVRILVHLHVPST
jgi:hypothetical protein